MIKDRIWTLVSRKLSGEATASELAEIETLIKTQAYSDLYLQAIDEYWASPAEKDEDFLEATYHLHLNRLKEKGFDLENEREKEDGTSLFLNYPVEVPQKKSFSHVYVAAAICAVFALILVVLFNVENKPGLAKGSRTNSSEISTKAGSRTRVQLPDGSSVWLNGGSKLVYDNQFPGNKFREVTLSGEAYFDVVKNVQKPFIIHTNNLEIKVIGTAFNVKAYPGERNTETSLIRGSIEITMKGRSEKIMMKPNEKLVIKNEEVPDDTLNVTGKKSSVVNRDAFASLSRLTFSADDSSIIETAWVDNKLIFDNETFEDVATKMERWYGVTFKFNDDSLKAVRMTGTFEKETVTDALTALQLLSPFAYTIKNNTIIIDK